MSEARPLGRAITATTDRRQERARLSFPQAALADARASDTFIDLTKPAASVIALQMSAPPREAFTTKGWKLIQRLGTPAKVQRWLTSLPYNWERRGGTMRSFRDVVKRNEAHCLEAAVAAAVILEQRGYPPLLLDIESVDLLDHDLFVFQKGGLWGSIGRSRDIGLHSATGLELFRSLHRHDGSH